MQQVQLVAVLCLIVVYAGSIQAFKWSYCSSSRVIDIKTLKVSPSPLKFPGKLNIDFEAVTHDRLNSSKVVVSMRKTGFLDLELPCKSNVGSCTYPDTCSLPDKLEKHIKTLLGNSGASYKCPILPQPIYLRNVALQLPALSDFLKNTLSGGLKIQIKVTDNASQKEYFCLKVEVSLDTGCKGWLCGGKRR